MLTSSACAFVRVCVSSDSARLHANSYQKFDFLLTFLHIIALVFKDSLQYQMYSFTFRDWCFKPKNLLPSQNLRNIVLKLTLVQHAYESNFNHHVHNPLVDEENLQDNSNPATIYMTMIFEYELFVYMTIT
jgi:hypothetical protein